MEVNQLISDNVDSERLQLRDPTTPKVLQEDPTLSVAICTKDNPEDLTRCLRYLRRLRESDGDTAFEILVVNNAPSDDRTEALVAALPDVRYVVEPKPGLNFARNRAVQEVSRDVLAFIDDDTTVDRYWLRGLKKALASHPDAGAVTGLVLPSELRTDAQILFEAYGGFEKAFKTIRYGASLPGHPFYPCVGGKFGTGCNMAFRRSLLLELGGFDEALDTGAALPGGGDTDMLYRVVRAGHPIIYEPEYMLFHTHRREHEQLRRQLCRSWGQGLMAFVYKSYRHDAPQRRNLRHLVRWWFSERVRELLTGMMGQHVLTADILAAHLWGGVVGLLGAYPRSVRRVEEIRKQYS